MISAMLRYKLSSHPLGSSIRDNDIDVEKNNEFRVPRDGSVGGHLCAFAEDSEISANSMRSESRTGCSEDSKSLCQPGR